MNRSLTPRSSRGRAGALDVRATRLAILDAAEELFRTIGFQKTAVIDIARELRMSPANVYRFFPSKTAINEAVCARILGALDERVRKLAESEGGAGARLRRLFRGLQQELMMLFTQKRHMRDLVVVALEEHWPVIDDHVHTVQSALATIVREGQATREFAPLDPEVTARRLYQAMTCFTRPCIIEFKFARQEQDDLAEAAEGMAEMMLRALRP